MERVKKRFYLPKRIINLLFGEDKELPSMQIGLLATNTKDDTVDQDTLIENIGNYIKSHNLNVFVGPEFLFVPKDRLYTKEEKDAIIQQLVALTKERNILLIPGTIMWEDDTHFYNTAPVIANGKILGEYNKRTDGHSIKWARSRGSKKKHYIGDKPGIYDWGELKVGVEICGDYGKLKKEFPKSNLDLYVIPSCGFDWGPFGGVMKEGDRLHAPPVRKQGYIFNSDGRRSISIVSPKYPNRMSPTTRDRQLDIYSINPD